MKLLKIVSVLLLAGVSFHLLASDALKGELNKALNAKDAVRVKELVKQGANLDAKDGFMGATLLQGALLFRKYDKAKILLKFGANPDLMGDKDGKSALHLCSKHPDLKCVELLLEFGADVDLKDQDGNTAIYYAMQKSANQLVEKLKEKGAVVPENVDPLPEKKESGLVKLLLGISNFGKGKFTNEITRFDGADADKNTITRHFTFSDKNTDDKEMLQLYQQARNEQKTRKSLLDFIYKNEYQKLCKNKLFNKLGDDKLLYISRFKFEDGADADSYDLKPSDCRR